MKILVFGKSGQVAQSLLAKAGKNHEITALGRAETDLMQPDKINHVIANTPVDVIINAAAYTAVDHAQTDADTADALNHLAVAAIGRAATAEGLPLVHISTDYVFPGSGEKAWKPDDPTDPLGVYGATKLAGETALNNNCERFAIMRTSWVFSSHGNNFVKTMLRLGKERDSLNVVSDQIGGPTSATDIAATAIAMAQSLVTGSTSKGTWHYTGQGDCSWAEFATEIFRQASIDCVVNPIPSSEYPTPATRPLNSRLDCTTMKTDFDIDRPHWKNSLSAVLKELGEIG